MLKRMEVVEPPKSAPQYMHESRMMAEMGSIEKVSGRSSDTPFGAPRPDASKADDAIAAVKAALAA